MSTEAACMNDTLGNALMIKVEELFAEMKIVESDGTARAHLQGILIIGDWRALFRREDGYFAFRNLMKFAARGSARLSCKRGFVLRLLLVSFFAREHGRCQGQTDNLAKVTVHQGILWQRTSTGAFAVQRNHHISRSSHYF